MTESRARIPVRATEMPVTAELPSGRENEGNEGRRGEEEER